MNYTQSLLSDLSKGTYKCSYLKSLTTLSGTYADGLQKIGLSPLAQLKGMAGIIESRELDEHGNLTMKALMTLGHSSPISLFNLMRVLPDTKLPDSLELGAAPVRIFSRALSTLGPTNIAMGESSIGITVGMSNELRRVLASKVVKGPLFSMVVSDELLALFSEVESSIDGVFDPHLTAAIVDIISGSLHKKKWVKIEMFSAELGIRVVNKVQAAAQ